MKTVQIQWRVRSQSVWLTPADREWNQHRLPAKFKRVPADQAEEIVATLNENNIPGTPESCRRMMEFRIKPCDG